MINPVCIICNKQISSETLNQYVCYCKLYEIQYENHIYKIPTFCLDIFKNKLSYIKVIYNKELVITISEKLICLSSLGTEDLSHFLCNVLRRPRIVHGIKNLIFKLKRGVSLI